MRRTLLTAGAIIVTLTGPIAAPANAAPPDGATMRPTPPQASDPKSESTRARGELLSALERLQGLAQQLQANAEEADQLQDEAERALAELRKAAQQLRESPVAHVAQEQFQLLEQGIEQARAQLQGTSSQAAEPMRQVAHTARQLDDRVQQQASGAQGEVAAAQSAAGTGERQNGSSEAGAAVSSQPLQAGSMTDEQVRQQYHESMAKLSPGSDSIIGRAVFSREGEEVGEVTNLIMSPEGRPEAMIVRGRGILGLGGRRVAVPWTQVQFRGDKVLVTLPKEQLSGLPEYRSDRP